MHTTISIEPYETESGYFKLRIQTEDTDHARRFVNDLLDLRVPFTREEKTADSLAFRLQSAQIAQWYNSLQRKESDRKVIINLNGRYTGLLPTLEDYRAHPQWFSPISMPSTVRTIQAKEEYTSTNEVTRHSAIKDLGQLLSLLDEKLGVSHEKLVGDGKKGDITKARAVFAYIMHARHPEISIKGIASMISKSQTSTSSLMGHFGSESSFPTEGNIKNQFNWAIENYQRG
jgi:hypothetical protein